MNQGRIWCVVNPTVGLPLFLGSVATISLLVHTSVMTNTDWMADYWQGAKPRTADSGAASTAVAAVPQPGAGFAISVSPVQTEGGGTSFVVTVTPAPGGTQAVQTGAASPAERAPSNTLALSAAPPS
jgi:light-harvesting protein B-800-850 alpha chain